MNILRKSRKSRFKLDKRRFMLLIFTLIMTTFAWITYSKVLLPNLKLHINSWNIEVFVDSNKNGVAEDDEKVADKSAPIVIQPFEVYPGMNQDVIEVLIKNNGEIPSIIGYDMLGIQVDILGETYTVVENAAAERTANPGNNYLQKNTPTTAAGISSYKLVNGEESVPFDFIIEHTQVVDGGAEGYLKVRAVWDATLDDDATEAEIDAKNELDGKWGYDITDYEIANPTTSPIKFNLSITSYSDNRSSRFVLTQDITPENYGDYVDYPVDLNGDGNTKNDWRIFYEDNENIYIISAGLVDNDLINPDITEKSNHSGCTEYGVSFTTSELVETELNQEIINKFMFTKAIPSDNLNYRTTKNLLSESYWDYFVNNSIANYAIGGPTLEMFVKSWNRKYNGIATATEIISWWNIKKHGYQVSEIPGEEHRLQLNGGENDDLYFPNHTADECYAYWLASPSIREFDPETGINIFTRAMMGIRIDTKIIAGGGIGNGQAGVRPVVQLKSGIFGESTVNGAGNRVWTLTTVHPDDRAVVANVVSNET